MAKKETFFTVSGWGVYNPGSSFHLEQRIAFSYSTAKKFLDPLLSQDRKDLEQQKKESEAKEKAVYADIQKLCKTWENHASQTLLLTRAMEYLDTKTVKHTKNQWKEAKDGTWEISNLVYKMRFKISKTAKQGELCLEWSVVYNIPDQPKSYWYSYNRYNNPWGADIYIVKPEKRTYTSLDSAQKFIQARFDEYVSFFTELSPPVPHECQKMFSVNGCLLPGYKAAPPEKTEQRDIDALLDFLDDEDTAPDAPASGTVSPESVRKEAPPAASPVEVPPAEKPIASHKPKPIHQNAKKSSRKKKKAAPER